mgnify:CR=1 FL=1
MVVLLVRMGVRVMHHRTHVAHSAQVSRSLVHHWVVGAWPGVRVPSLLVGRRMMVRAWLIMHVLPARRLGLAHRPRGAGTVPLLMLVGLLKSCTLLLLLLVLDRSFCERILIRATSGSFFSLIRRIDLVDFNVFRWEPFSASFGIDFQMVRVAQHLGMTMTVPVGAHPIQRLFCLSLVVNVQMGPVRGLNRNDEALVLLVGHTFRVIGCRAALVVVPDGQIFQIFVCDVGVVSVLRIRKNLLLLFLQLANQFV